MPHRALTYIQQVQKGTVTVPKWVQLAVKRHLADLRRSKTKDYPYFFSPTHAAAAIEACELQRLAFGKYNGQPVVLQPWQAFVIYSIYGWRRKRGHERRFVKALIKVARGNAKTELAAMVANLGLIFEPENDPQVFWVATKKDQSKIGFDRQRTMVQYLRDDYDEIREMVDTSKYSIYETGAGKGSVKYLGKEFKGEDGFSPYYIIGDEYHAWKDDGLMHVMESGTIKRDSSLTFIISTEGYNPEGPFAQMTKRCKQMLLGDAENDQMFALLYELDEGDDWQDRRNWVKANPSIGVTVTLDGMESEYQKARAEGIVKENDFKTKNLNIGVSGAVTWIPNETWLTAGKPFNADTLKGRLCFGGLDLARNRDLAAFVLFFPSPDLLDGDGAERGHLSPLGVGSGIWAKDKKPEPHYCLCRFYLPEVTARDKTRLDGIPYLQWASEGWLTVVPGDILEYDYIRKDIMSDAYTYDLHSIAFDRDKATQLVKSINDEKGNQPQTQTNDFMEGFAQLCRHFTAPLLELEKMVVHKTFNHGQNPILNWNNRNVVLFTDTNDNFKLDKKKSANKIDGMVALAMAIGQYMTYKHTLDPGGPDIVVL